MEWSKLIPDELPTFGTVLELELDELPELREVTVCADELWDKVLYRCT